MNYTVEEIIRDIKNSRLILIEDQLETALKTNDELCEENDDLRDKIGVIASKIKSKDTEIDELREKIHSLQLVNEKNENGNIFAIDRFHRCNISIL